MKLLTALRLVTLGLLPFLSRAQPQIPLGAGLDGVTDWSQSRPFVDVMKGNRGFGSAQTPYDGRPSQLDANGWPLGDFGVVVMTDMKDNADLYGTYRLSFKGQATVGNVASDFSVQNYRYDAATNVSTADLVVPVRADNQMMLSFRNVGTGGVQDIQLLMPGYPSTDTFTRPLKEHLQRFQVLRFMDWTSTNGNPVQQWSERTLPTAASQMSSKGVAWEYCIQLCNETRKDLWVNIPLKADDNYVRQLARLIREQLDPSLKCYVEYSNEIWNYNFPQFQQNVDLATAEVQAGNSDLDDGAPNDAWKWAHRRTGKRLMQISNVFKDEFGAAALNARIRPVLAGQTGNPAEFPNTALNFVNDHYGPPKNFFYAVAGAPYFGLGEALDQRTDLTKEDVLNGFRQNIIGMWTPSNTRNSPRSSEFDVMTAQATWFGLRHFCYEGGPDTFGPNNIRAKKDASLDPAMKDIVADYLRGWYGHGGADGLFTWFVAGATNYDSPYGTWGLTNSMTNLNAPKIQGIDQVLATIQPTVTAGFSVLDSIDTRQHVGYRTGWQTTNPNALPYLHAGDYHDYLLNAPTTGGYRLRVRLAQVAANALPASKIRLWINNVVVDSLLTPGDPQNTWDKFVLSAAVTLRLTQGLNVLRLQYVTECNATKTLLFEPVNGPVLRAGTYALKARHSGQALDVSNSATTDGARVQQYTPNGTAAQQWDVQPVGNGYYSLRARCSGKVLDVDGGSTATANGVKVQQWSYHGTDNQLWRITPVGGGYYQLIAKHSGKCLDVSNWSAADEAQVHQWTYGGGANQQWAFEPVGSTARAAATPAPAGAILSAYPNPSRGVATLQLTTRAAQTATVQVRDGRGRLVSQFAVPIAAGRTDHPLPGPLAPGTYFVQTHLDGKTHRFTLRID